MNDTLKILLLILAVSLGMTILIQAASYEYDRHVGEGTIYESPLRADRSMSPCAGLETEVIPIKPGEPEPTAWDETSTYPLTKEEIELIAVVTMGEAEGETELGKRLVIDTILNRVDDPRFPDSVHDVVYQPEQFDVMWNGRIDDCYATEEIVALVKEELSYRTNGACLFFKTGGYSTYGTPLLQECCHYFSTLDK